MFRFFRRPKSDAVAHPNDTTPASPEAKCTTPSFAQDVSATPQNAKDSATPPSESATSLPPHDAAAIAEQPPLSWRERLRQASLTRNLAQLFARNPRLDENLLDDIETILLSADAGVNVTQAIIERLRAQIKGRSLANSQALWLALRTELMAILTPVAKPLDLTGKPRPFVILVVGINGVGKTTTIGKLAMQFKQTGHRVLLAAADTFRAAAVAQLQAWGQRNEVGVIAQGQSADAAAVAYDAIQAAKARHTAVLLVDTAGRLHTQAGLMNELSKIARVITKVEPSAPHEVLMVIDGTTGQNALSQVRLFLAAIPVTGLIVTKLDGSAKGGVIFALAREFSIPIRYIGIGEKLTDLRAFDPNAFIDALMPEQSTPPQST